MRSLSRATSRKLGFTLVELMIVVAIVGILAVLAVYGVRKYVSNSKTAEARNSLGQIAKDAATAYENEAMSPAIMTTGSATAITRRVCGTGTVTFVPANTSQIKGQKYQSTLQDWTNSTDVAAQAGWPCVHFEIDSPQYFRYGYSGSGTGSVGASFNATANGDLNGDGVVSTFGIVGTVNSSFILNTAPQVSELSPDE